MLLSHADYEPWASANALAALEPKAGELRLRWRANWVVDLDIQGFFDSIDHELLLKALRKHTDCRWVLLYVERWLKAPIQMEDGRMEPRMTGTPQGGVVSSPLANLFLHYPQFQP